MRQILWLKFPLFVKWYITGKCNIRCEHCYLTDYSGQGDLANVLRFIDYFGQKKIRLISLLGGEPLVRDDLESIIERIVANKIDLKITTNAILATKERAKSLYTAGARAFQVSLEGPDPSSNDAVRGKNTFQRAVEGTLNLKSAGGALVLAFTITAKNFQLVPKMFSLANELGAGKIRIMAFAPVGTGEKHKDELLLNREVTLHVRAQLKSLAKQFPHLLIDSPFILPEEESCGGCPSSSTLGCGAGTSTLIMNNNLSISACDLLTEEDRTSVKVDKPEDIEKIWLEDRLFLKWRGLSEDSTTRTIQSFSDVHQHGCHVVNQTYRENIFRA